VRSKPRQALALLALLVRYAVSVPVVSNYTFETMLASLLAANRGQSVPRFLGCARSSDLKKGARRSGPSFAYVPASFAKLNHKFFCNGSGLFSVREKSTQMPEQPSRTCAAAAATFVH
jgi:hypothetical protein